MRLHYLPRKSSSNAVDELLEFGIIGTMASTQDLRYSQALDCLLTDLTSRVQHSHQIRSKIIDSIMIHAVQLFRGVLEFSDSIDDSGETTYTIRSNLGSQFEVAVMCIDNCYFTDAIYRLTKYMTSAVNLWSPDECHPHHGGNDMHLRVLLSVGIVTNASEWYFVACTQDQPFSQPMIYRSQIPRMIRYDTESWRDDTKVVFGHIVWFMMRTFMDTRTNPERPRRVFSKPLVCPFVYIGAVAVDSGFRAPTTRRLLEDVHVILRSTSPSFQKTSFLIRSYLTNAVDLFGCQFGLICDSQPYSEHMPEPTTHTVKTNDGKPFFFATEVNNCSFEDANRRMMSFMIPAAFRHHTHRSVGIVTDAKRWDFVLCTLHKTSAQIDTTFLISTVPVTVKYDADDLNDNVKRIFAHIVWLFMSSLIAKVHH
ncbi:hypothetical protein BGX28_010349 [Mortierella sp. GBA30]|nr:hypothetical protein BGX28_010349 [Mortierella sp. GBA30]